jgi:uncharacterized membrane protein
MDYLSSDYRGIARDKLKGKWWISLLATLVAGILGGLNTGSEFRLNTSQFKQLSENLPDRLGEPFVAVYGALRYASTELFGDSSVLVIVYLVCLAIVLIVGSAVRLGHNMFYIDLCNNRGTNFSTLFSRFTILGKAVGQRLYMGLFMFLWSLVFVIPGIVAAYRYALAPYLLAQNPEMSGIDAVQESKELMRGHKWRLFCLDLSFIGWWLLCILTLGIGLLWLNPYRYAARAAFYLDRTEQGELLNMPEPS